MAYRIVRSPLFWLILLSAVLYFFQLGSFSLYDAAETTYGEFIKGMLQTGDWLTLHYNGQIIFDKPPLYYWLVVLLSHLSGFNEWAIRFWAALAGVLTVAVTYLFGRELFQNERAGLSSALIVMTAFQFLVQARIAELDMLLTLLITLALYLFYLGYRRQDRRFFLMSYLPMGFALLVKGLLGVALPALTIFLFLACKKELSKIKNIFPFLGVVIILLIGLPWYIVEYLRHGQVFLDFALGFLFLTRFSDVVCGHTGPWYYYFFALLLGFAPWSQFLPFAFYRSAKNWRNDPDLISLCLIVPAFLVFSIAQTKLPNYVLPLYPFMALLVGGTWNAYWSTPKAEERGMNWSNLLFGVVIVLLIIGFTIAAGNYQGDYQALVPLALALAGILIAGGLIYLAVFYLLRQPLVAFALIPATVFLLAFFLIGYILPVVELYKGTKILTLKVQPQLGQKTIVAAYDVGNRPSVVFYNPRPIVFLSSEADAATFLRQKKGYCYTQTTNLNRLSRYASPFAVQGDLCVFH